MSTSSPVSSSAVKFRSKLSTSAVNYAASLVVAAPTALAAALVYWLWRRRPKLVAVAALLSAAWLYLRRRRQRAAKRITAGRRFRVAVVGSGFGGILAAIKLRQRGCEVRVYERESSLGGTWKLNTYPGSGCDVPSLYYCYSFFPHDWTRKWALQPEILGYLQRAADHFGVSNLISYNRAVTSVEWNEEKRKYAVTTAAARTTAPLNGIEPQPLTQDVQSAEFDFVILATGQLNIPATPNIPGIGSFERAVAVEGERKNHHEHEKVAMHTARWDHSVPIAGKRVGVIGTGPSAVQVVPEIGKLASHLTVFQRSSSHCHPRGDFAYSALARRIFRHVPLARRVYRLVLFVLTEMQWFMFFVGRKNGGGDGPSQASARNRFASKLVTNDMRDRVKTLSGSDQKAAAVCPKSTVPLGCKRLLISDAYLETIAQPHVSLVTDSVEEIVAGAVVTKSASGEHTTHDLDVLVYATGFHASKFCSTLRVVGADHPSTIRMTDGTEDGSSSSSSSSSSSESSPQSFAPIPVGSAVRIVGLDHEEDLREARGTVIAVTATGGYSVWLNQWHEKSVWELRRRNLVRQTVLSEEWGDEPQAFLGIAMPRFPNLFLLYGPSTNLGHSSIVFMMECQMDHIIAVIDQVAKSNNLKASRVEVKPQVMRSYITDLQKKLLRTVWNAGCKNWYANKAGVVINNWAASCTEYWLATSPSRSTIARAYKFE